MSSASSFGDVILCPVCLVMYENRIMQCSQGHSVCEHCYSRLIRCPTCRSIFSGARNYALEDVMSKLHSMYPAEGEKPSDSDSADEKENSQSPDYSRQVNQIRVNRGPVQGSGHFRCRVDACVAFLPVCRMHNHLRYHHAKQWSEYRNTSADKELQFLESWKMSIRSMSRAVKITKVGLFFVIVDVQEASAAGADRTVSAWVEGVCPTVEARNYRFGCDLVYGQKAASYCDNVYGGNPDVKDIKRSSECLQVLVPAKVHTMLLQIRIYKSTESNSVSRNSTTTVRSLPNLRNARRPNVIRQ